MREPISFGAQINGLGFQGGAASEDAAFQRLDFDLAVAQNPLEGLPDTGLHQGIDGIQDQKSSVGFHDGTRFDMREIRPPDAVAVDHALDGSEKVFVPRVGLNDDGWALLAAVVHNDVDLVLEELIFLLVHLDPEDGCLGLFVLRVKPLHVLEHVLLHIIQEQTDGVRCVFRFQIVEKLLDKGDDDLVRQLVKGFLRPSLDVAHFPHDKIHLPFQIRLRGKGLVEIGLRHLSGVDFCLELFNACGISIDHGSNLRTHRWTRLDLNNLEALLLHAFLEVLEHAALPGLEVFEKGFSLLLVASAFEQRGDAFQQLGDEAPHVLPERRPVSRG